MGSIDHGANYEGVLRLRATPARLTTQLAHVLRPSQAARWKDEGVQVAPDPVRPSTPHIKGYPSDQVGVLRVGVSAGRPGT